MFQKHFTCHSLFLTVLTCFTFNCHIGNINHIDRASNIEAYLTIVVSPIYTRLYKVSLHHGYTIRGTKTGAAIQTLFT
jgi:hypothetical protein